MNEDSIRQENIEDEVLSKKERLLFDTMSLHEYEKNRKERGLPPLTKWQHEQLTNERLVQAGVPQTETRQGTCAE